MNNAAKTEFVQLLQGLKRLTISLGYLFGTLARQDCIKVSAPATTGDD